MTDKPATSIADILDKAAATLSEPGVWAQAGVHNARGTGRHCAATAMGWSGEPCVDDARSFFAKHVGAGFRTQDVYRWNDAPERTQPEVVAKLREAANLARERGL